MDFQLSEEQCAIADMADKLFSDYCTDERLRAFDGAGLPFMEALWAKCVETGLHALALPAACGGSGLGMTELMLVLESQGRALAQVPLWQHQLAAATLAQFGGAAGLDLASSAAAAETLLTFSLDGLARARGAQLEARPEGDGWRLRGTVAALPTGSQAQGALLLVALPQGLRLVALRLEAPGIVRTARVHTHGAAVADLVCEGVPVTATQVLPEAALSWLETRAIAALAALQLGVSSAQLRRAVEYVAERKQFERAIGSFQAVQMSMADAGIAIEALRSALWQLVYRLDAGLPAVPEALAVRYLACEAGHLVGHRAQHVHGGIGVDLSYPAHRYLLWSRALGLVLGGTAASLERLGDWLAESDRLGWKYDLEERAAL